MQGKKLEEYNNENWTEMIVVNEPVKKDWTGSGFVTNCRICFNTCHKGCAFKDDEDKHRCIAMDESGHCKNCVKRCRWDVHKNEPFFWVYEPVKKPVTNETMKSLWEGAKTEQEKEATSLANLQKQMIE